MSYDFVGSNPTFAIGKLPTTPVINIVSTGCSWASLAGITCSIPSLTIVTTFGLITNFYEMFNAGLQLFIFTLLAMDYDSGIEIFNG